MTRHAVILDGARADFREIKKHVRQQFGDLVWAFTNPAYPLRVQRQARDQACQRVRSGLTQMMRVIEGDESSIHAEFHEVISGQLRFLGLYGLKPAQTTPPAGPQV